MKVQAEQPTCDFNSAARKSIEPWYRAAGKERDQIILKLPRSFKDKFSSSAQAAGTDMSSVIFGLIDYLL